MVVDLSPRLRGTVLFGDTGRVARRVGPRGGLRTTDTRLIGGNARAFVEEEEDAVVFADRGFVGGTVRVGRALGRRIVLRAADSTLDFTAAIIDVRRRRRAEAVRADCCLDARADVRWDDVLRAMPRISQAPHKGDASRALL